MRKTQLIIIGGFAGAGKSTIVRRLAKDLELPYIDSDEVIAEVQRERGQEFHAAAPIAYDRLWPEIHERLGQEQSVILDTNMCNPRAWERVEEVRARFPDVQILPVILECSLEVHRTRVEQRAKDPANANLLGGDQFDDVLFKYEFLKQLNRPDIIRIDANHVPEDVYADVRALVQASIDEGNKIR